jgi:modulator of FtsH protease
MQPELHPNSVYTGGVAYGVPQQRVLRNTYLLLALTMIPTVIGAMVGMSMVGIFMQHPIIASLGMLAAVIGLQFAIAANRDSGLGVALLLLMTFLLGCWLGPILTVALSLKNGPQLVGFAAGGTGVILAVMATIATRSKRDFSSMGKFLFVGMMAVLLVGIANMFMQIPLLALTLSALALVIFSLYLLYDVSRIVNGGETNYIMAATGVYISIWAIFTNLLQLLMALMGEKD